NSRRQADSAAPVSGAAGPGNPVPTVTAGAASAAPALRTHEDPVRTHTEGCDVAGIADINRTGIAADAGAASSTVPTPSFTTRPPHPTRLSPPPASHPPRAPVAARAPRLPTRQLGHRGRTPPPPPRPPGAPGPAPRDPTVAPPAAGAAPA